MPFLPLPPRTVARGGGRGLLVNSIHGVDTLRYVVVHSGISCTCFTEVLSSYAIIYRLSTSNHNCCQCDAHRGGIVLYRLSTSNHNMPHTRSRVILIVLYRLSTSNHNLIFVYNGRYAIVLYRLSTSNHNRQGAEVFRIPIVLYRLSTSNHNSNVMSMKSIKLSYIVFLHQTTTST